MKKTALSYTAEGSINEHWSIIHYLKLLGTEVCWNLEFFRFLKSNMMYKLYNTPCRN